MILTELKRFFWRRSFRFFGLLCVVGVVTAGAIVFFVSDQSQPFRLTMLQDIFVGTSIPLIILGLAFGASFIGAEWGVGTITTLLTWEPRRIVVIAAKAIALFVAVAIASVVLQLFLGAALIPAAAFKGSTSGIDGSWLVETAEVLGRGAIVAALMSLIGFSIAGLARNTTVALIIGFVYFAIGEPVLRGLKPEWQEWLVGDNAAAFMSADPDSVFGISHTRPGLTSLVVLAAYALIGVSIVAAVFNSRDVT